MANITKAAKSRWGREFKIAISTIKKTYTYDYVHNATSMTKLLAECAEADSARNLRDAPAPGAQALSAYKSILRGGQSDYSSDSESDLNPEAFINSDGVAYLTTAGKRLMRSNNSSFRSSERSQSSSIASSSDSSKAAKKKEKVEVVECKHCKKYERTKPHPPKVPVDKCMWNPDYIGYRFENVCKKMGLKYKATDKFPKGKKDEWKKHKKLETAAEA